MKSCFKKILILTVLTSIFSFASCNKKEKRMVFVWFDATGSYLKKNIKGESFFMNSFHDFFESTFKKVFGLFSRFVPSKDVYFIGAITDYVDDSCLILDGKRLSLIMMDKLNREIRDFEKNVQKKGGFRKTDIYGTFYLMYVRSQDSSRRDFSKVVAIYYSDMIDTAHRVKIDKDLANFLGKIRIYVVSPPNSTRVRNFFRRVMDRWKINIHYSIVSSASEAL